MQRNTLLFAAIGAVLLVAPGAQCVELSGKVAVVTGASRGIGEATSHVLAERGVKVVLASRSTKALEGVKAAIEAKGGTATVAKCDVTKAADVKATFEHAKTTYGGVDFVFANAGYEGKLVDLGEIEDEEIDKVININVLGYLYTMKYALQSFRAQGGGAIIFVSSIASIVPRHMAMNTPMMKTIVPYGVTKAANDYTARVSSAFADENIRAYGILPGCFETHMLQQIAVSQGSVDKEGKAVTDPLAGFNPVYPEAIGDPIHIGKVVAAMFDNSTKYLPGQTVVADGDATVLADVFYPQMHQGGTGGGAWQHTVKADTICDYKGDPYPSKEL